MGTYLKCSRGFILRADVLITSLRLVKTSDEEQFVVHPRNTLLFVLYAVGDLYFCICSLFDEAVSKCKLWHRYTEGVRNRGKKECN